MEESQGQGDRGNTKNELINWHKALSDFSLMEKIIEKLDIKGDLWLNNSVGSWTNAILQLHWRYLFRFTTCYTSNQIEKKNLKGGSGQNACFFIAIFL